jgi:FdhD protein
MDKALGALLLEGRWPLSGLLACLSGRAGFELVQKGSVAGLAGVVSVGAPSSLAVDLAQEERVTTYEPAQEKVPNVYAGADRLAS